MDEKPIKWLEIVLWFVLSAFASTYLNTSFLREFYGDAMALTFVRFLGSAILGWITNALLPRGVPMSELVRLSPQFILPSFCLLMANLFNCVSLDRGGITLTYVVKAGIPLVTVRDRMTIGDDGKKKELT